MAIIALADNVHCGVNAPAPCLIALPVICVEALALMLDTPVPVIVADAVTEAEPNFKTVPLLSRSPSADSVAVVLNVAEVLLIALPTAVTLADPKDKIMPEPTRFAVSVDCSTPPMVIVGLNVAVPVAESVA